MISILLVAAAACEALRLFAADTTLSRWVDPSRKGGWAMFKGADIPFGMVMAGAPFGGWSKSHGISFTHLSGAHVDPGKQNHVRLTAITGAPNDSGWPLKSIIVRDSAAPGYYRCQLPGGIVLEVAASCRTAMLRLRFPRSVGEGTVFCSPQFDIDDSQPTCKGQARINKSDQMAGNGFKNTPSTYLYDKGSRVCFVAQANRSSRASGVGMNGTIRRGDTAVSGMNPYAFLTFDTRTDSVVLIKIGMSYVSEANAKLNLDAEMSGWDFDAVRNAALGRWEQALGRARVEGGSDQDRKVFYTALYRSLFHCNVYSDINGQYNGFDNTIHTATGYTQYANYSGWDIYHCWSQLIGLLFPAEGSDMAWSLITHGAECGAVPRWTMTNIECAPMEGDPGQMIVTNLRVFGGNRFDLRKAVEVLERNATVPDVNCQSTVERPALATYLSKGWVPQSASGVSAPRKQSVGTGGSHTIQYCIGDFCLGNLYAALGDSAQFRSYMRRAQNWKNIFNPGTGHLQARAYDGSWTNGGFSEGGWQQYTWMVPHSIKGLFDLMGGAAPASAKLDEFFTQIGGSYGGNYACLGNETSLGTPWLYNWARQSWKTQELVRRALTQLHYPGSPGDDDLGALSSWCVWSALGLYPSISGVAGFSIHSPLFPKTTIAIGQSKTLVVEAENAAADAPYVQSLTLNGKAYTRTWLPLALLNRPVNTLHFVCGKTPNKQWGTGPEDTPPSFDSGSPAVSSSEYGMTRAAVVRSGPRSNPFMVTPAGRTIGLVNPSSQWNGAFRAGKNGYRGVVFVISKQGGKPTAVGRKVVLAR